MIDKLHGSDRHRKYSTIIVLNRKGEEIDSQLRRFDLKRFVNRLGPEDAVIDSYKFGNIRDS